MMLARIPRLSTAPRYAARSFSSVDCDAMPKLKAFPFTKSPSQALMEMGPLGGVLLGVSPLVVMGKLIANTLNTLDPHQVFMTPKRFEAAYFPAWIVNGEVKVDIAYKTSKWNASSVFLKKTYIPGSHMPVISAAPLWSEELEDGEAVPFSQALTKQHGMDVSCIPFSVSPFSIIDEAKSRDSLRLSPDLSFSPDSIKPGFFSASPVLIPVYLARYEDDGDLGVSPREEPISIMLTGFGENLKFMADGAALKNRKNLKSFLIKLTIFDKKPEEISEVEVLTVSISRINGSIPALRFRGFDTGAVFEKLEDQLNDSDNIAKLASARDLNEDLQDPRIREFTKDEQESTEMYFDFRHKALELEFVKNTIGGLRLPEGVEITTQVGDMLQSEVSEEEATPQWWLDYQASKKDGEKP